jgi:glycine/D-amino acid oxidase-like deaminating enzyme
MMGRVMSQVIMGREPELPLHDFRPDRFVEAK